MTGKRGYTTDRFNEELLHIKLEIQAHSLDMMIREIYENVGQVLSLARLNLTALQAYKKPDIQKTISSSGELVGKAIRDLRLLSNPVTTKEISEKGFIAALQHEVATVNRIGNNDILLQVSESFKRFNAAEELILFRIVQECVLLVSEYATGKTVTIHADYHPKEILISIRSQLNTLQADNSQAAFPVLVKAISSKARMINAGLSVISNPGEGPEIQIRLSVST